jgi:hypothetical protein
MEITGLIKNKKKKIELYLTGTAKPPRLKNLKIGFVGVF